MSILIRSMGPISDIDMVTRKIYQSVLLWNICCLQHYSMDCYFRQYWRDTRLSFKGLKMNSNQLHINQLSLNVKMLGTIALNLQLNFSFSLWYIWEWQYFIKPDWEQLLRKNLEAWHILSQWSGLLPAHHHQAEQTVQDLWEWRHHLLHEVSKER